MKKQKALVISEDTLRKNFLNQELEKAGFYPITYPNIYAYRKALELEDIKIIVADLSIPLEPKIDIIIKGAKKIPSPSLITIGKQEYITQSKVFDNYPMVICLNNIQEFPDALNQL